MGEGFEDLSFEDLEWLGKMQSVEDEMERIQAVVEAIGNDIKSSSDPVQRAIELEPVRERLLSRVEELQRAVESS